MTSSLLNITKREGGNGEKGGRVVSPILKKCLSFKSNEFSSKYNTHKFNHQYFSPCNRFFQLLPKKLIKIINHQ
jgi:hypothetical protein